MELSRIQINDGQNETYWRELLEKYAARMHEDEKDPYDEWDGVEELDFNLCSREVFDPTYTKGDKYPYMIAAYPLKDNATDGSTVLATAHVMF